jgi:hypothetical protein
MKWVRTDDPLLGGTDAPPGQTVDGIEVPGWPPYSPILTDWSGLPNKLLPLSQRDTFRMIRGSSCYSLLIRSMQVLSLPSFNMHNTDI